MKNTFKEIETSFMALSQLLQGLDFNRDLEDIDLIDRVNEALSTSYILLNQGFCENNIVCLSCVEFRDNLLELITFIDYCERTGIISEETALSLEYFSTEIPNILINLQKMYLESTTAIKV